MTGCHCTDWHQKSSDSYYHHDHKKPSIYVDQLKHNCRSVTRHIPSHFTKTDALLVHRIHSMCWEPIEACKVIKLPAPYTRIPEKMLSNEALRRYDDTSGTVPCSPCETFQEVSKIKQRAGRWSVKKDGWSGGLKEEQNIPKSFQINSCMS